jgi:hypothetical protein
MKTKLFLMGILIVTLVFGFMSCSIDGGDNPTDSDNIIGVLLGTQEPIHGFTFFLDAAKIPEGTKKISFYMSGDDYGGWVYERGISEAKQLMPPYPFAQSGKTYTFFVGFIDKQGKEFKRSAPLMLMAESGIGEMKIPNAAEVKVVYDPTDKTVRLNGTPKLPDFTDTANIVRTFIEFSINDGASWEDPNAKWRNGGQVNNIAERLSLVNGLWSKAANLIGRYPMFSAAGYDVEYTYMGENFTYQSGISASSEPFTFPDFPYSKVSGTIGAVMYNGQPYTGKIRLGTHYNDGNGDKILAEIETLANSAWEMYGDPILVNSTLSFGGIWLIDPGFAVDIEGVSLPLMAGKNEYSGVKLGDAAGTSMEMSGTVNIVINDIPYNGGTLHIWESESGRHLGHGEIKSDGTWKINILPVNGAASFGIVIEGGYFDSVASFGVFHKGEYIPIEGVTQTITATGGPYTGINLGNLNYTTQEILPPTQVQQTRRPQRFFMEQRVLSYPPAMRWLSRWNGLETRKMEQERLSTAGLSLKALLSLN